MLRYYYFNRNKVNFDSEIRVQDIQLLVTLTITDLCAPIQQYNLVVNLIKKIEVERNLY